MQVHYTERHVAINDAEKEKAAVKFAKINRVLSANKDLEANVVLSKNGADVEAEVTLHALHHTLVVTDTNGNAFTALNPALAKLEKQAHKNKDKLIANRRRRRQSENSRPPIQGSAQEPEVLEVEPEPAPEPEAEPEPELEPQTEPGSTGKANDRKV